MKRKERASQRGGRREERGNRQNDLLNAALLSWLSVGIAHMHLIRLTPGDTMQYKNHSTNRKWPLHLRSQQLILTDVCIVLYL